MTARIIFAGFWLAILLPVIVVVMISELNYKRAVALLVMTAFSAILLFTDFQYGFRNEYSVFLLLGLGLFAATAVVLLLFQVVQARKRILNLQFPPTVVPRQLGAYSIRYLRHAGWIVRGGGNGYDNEIFRPDKSHRMYLVFLPSRHNFSATDVKRASECVGHGKWRIVFISMEPVPRDFQEMCHSNKMLTVHYRGLDQVEDLVRA